MQKTFVLFLSILFYGCHIDKQKISLASSPEEPTPYEKTVKHPYQTFKGLTVDSRFKPPKGFRRKPVPENSFANYLRKLPLKTPGSKVKYFDGRVKENVVHAAVVDLKIGDKDLHQCADAIMRLKAEHHWFQKDFDKIHFNFTNGFKVEYNEWRKGRSMIVEGNKTYWDKRSEPKEGYNNFWDYLELIFTYSGTMSLELETNALAIDKLEIGDIFIQGGSPGHAVIVVDMAINEKNKKVFLLAQSYMPAQELHILVNSNNELSPWYNVPSSDLLITPEWEFKTKDLRRFDEL